MHGQFGDATLYVTDQKAAMTLSDVCGQIARIDGPFLESCLVHVTAGFGILAAAEDKKLSLDKVRKFQAVAGHGISGRIADRQCLFGNEALIARSPQMLAICSIGAGYDVIDVDAEYSELALEKMQHVNGTIRSRVLF